MLMRNDDDSRVIRAVSGSDLELLLDALDSHEYWQLGEGLPRNNGLVWLPGDGVDVTDRYWGDEQPTVEQREAIRAVERCRELADRLRAEIIGMGSR